MELQQQQQQVVQLEGLENATARTLLGKLINVLLAVMAVLLVFVSTVANCVVPLMKTRSRTLSTLLLVILLAFLWRHWDAISEYLNHFLLHPRWPAWRGLFDDEGQRFWGCCVKGGQWTHTGRLISIVLPFLPLQQLLKMLRRFESEVCHFIVFWNVFKEEWNREKDGCLILNCYL